MSVPKRSFDRVKRRLQLVRIVTSRFEALFERGVQKRVADILVDKSDDAVIVEAFNTERIAGICGRISSLLGCTFDCCGGFLGRPFMTSAGVCTSPIPDGTVS